MEQTVFSVQNCNSVIEEELYVHQQKLFGKQRNQKKLASRQHTEKQKRRTKLVA
jgi:hypothetical protein